MKQVARESTYADMNDERNKIFETTFVNAF
jgi:hypothetical protein